MMRIAVSRLPLPSLTSTVKILTPRLLLSGVPDNAPFAATLSHEGPFVFVKVKLSPSRSFAELAILCPV